MRSQQKINKYPQSLSVLLPAFNEEKRLGKAFKICRSFKNRFPGWEFIFVNDGSSDKTEEMIKKSGFKWVSYKLNQGKGYALKQGAKQASKAYVLICDVDFSTPLAEVGLLYPFIEKGAEGVIGSRKVQGARVLKHQPVIREWLGRQFTNLSKIWLGLKVSDVTCGFKLFTKQAAKELFGKSHIKGWGYDAEILFLAKKLKFKVVDVPVTWENDDRTKVSIGKDIWLSLIDLYLIRLNNLLGKY